MPFFVKIIDMLTQCLVPPITKKVISYSLVHEATINCSSSSTKISLEIFYVLTKNTNTKKTTGSTIYATTDSLLANFLIHYLNIISIQFYSNKKFLSKLDTFRLGIPF